MINLCLSPGPIAGDIGFEYPAACIFEIQSSPTDHLCIVEIILLLANNANNSSALDLGFGVPAVKGNGVLGLGFISEDSGNTDTGPGAQLYFRWSQRPTAPTNFLRRIILNMVAASATAPAAITAAFQFPRGYIMPPSSSAVVWCPAAPSQAIPNIIEANIVIDA